jgi:hypothetical protein
MKNELLFLGTSACEFSPRLESDLKCKFDKDARRSSAAIYGGRYLLDCGIHTPESLGIAGCELGKITDIFITHLHRDHYIEENIAQVAKGAGGVRLWVREDAKEISIPGVTVMRMKPFVTYEVEAKSRTINISGDSFPGTYYITGDTYARSDVTGADQFFQFIIPKAKVTSENTITLEAEGDPAVFNMSLTVLRPDDGIMMQLVQYTLDDPTAVG